MIKQKYLKSILLATGFAVLLAAFYDASFISFANGQETEGEQFNTEFQYVDVGSATEGLKVLSEAQSVAVEFVNKTGVNKNFQYFLLQAATYTTTIMGLSKEYGANQVFEILKIEIDRVVSKYKDRWDQNLADAYLEYFSVEELESILKEKRNSPFAAKFKEQQAAVGAIMKESSRPILEEALPEVLMAVFQYYQDKK